MTYTFEEFHDELEKGGYQPSPISSDGVGGFEFWVKGIKIDRQYSYTSFEIGGYQILTREDIEADFFPEGSVMVHFGGAHFSIYTMD